MGATVSRVGAITTCMLCPQARCVYFWLLPPNAFNLLIQYARARIPCILLDNKSTLADEC